MGMRRKAVLFVVLWVVLRTVIDWQEACVGRNGRDSENQ